MYHTFSPSNGGRLLGLATVEFWRPFAPSLFCGKFLPPGVVLSLRISLIVRCLCRCVSSFVSTLSVLFILERVRPRDTLMTFV